MRGRLNDGDIIKGSDPDLMPCIRSVSRRPLSLSYGASVVLIMMVVDVQWRGLSHCETTGGGGGAIALSRAVDKPGSGWRLECGPRGGTTDWQEASYCSL